MTASGHGDLALLEARRWLDLQPQFEEARFLNGFGFLDGKFRLSADWEHVPFANDGLRGDWRRMPRLPDHWPVKEDADDYRPFKLATSPAHNFLNSSFTQTPISVVCERRPEALVNPTDAAHSASWTATSSNSATNADERVYMRTCSPACSRASSSAKACGLRRPSSTVGGINVLVGDDSVPPFGCVAFHDVRVWARA